MGLRSCRLCQLSLAGSCFSVEDELQQVNSSGTKLRADVRLWTLGQVETPPQRNLHPPPVQSSSRPIQPPTDHYPSSSISSTSATSTRTFPDRKRRRPCTFRLEACSWHSGDRQDTWPSSSSGRMSTASYVNKWDLFSSSSCALFVGWTRGKGCSGRNGRTANLHDIPDDLPRSHFPPGSRSPSTDPPHPHNQLRAPLLTSKAVAPQALGQSHQHALDPPFDPHTHRSGGKGPRQSVGT